MAVTPVEPDPNNVETMPWGSYPLAWDARELQLLGPRHWDGDTYARKTVFEAAPAGEPNIGWQPQGLDCHRIKASPRRMRAPRMR